MQSSPPSLVIMDVKMPAGNGLAVCEMMRDNSQLKEVPVVMITGHDEESVRSRARILNAHYLCKSPGLWEELRPLCEQILGTSFDTGDQREKAEKSRSAA
jgi:DNA-binding response OmpR family regulator